MCQLMFLYVSYTLYAECFVKGYFIMTWIPVVKTTSTFMLIWLYQDFIKFFLLSTCITIMNCPSKQITPFSPFRIMLGIQPPGFILNSQQTIVKSWTHWMASFVPHKWCIDICICFSSQTHMHSSSGRYSGYQQQVSNSTMTEISTREEQTGKK